jgi:hypothetical protein
MVNGGLLGVRQRTLSSGTHTDGSPKRALTWCSYRRAVPFWNSRGGDQGSRCLGQFQLFFSGCRAGTSSLHRVRPGLAAPALR